MRSWVVGWLERDGKLNRGTTSSSRHTATVPKPLSFEPRILNPEPFNLYPLSSEPRTLNLDGLVKSQKNDFFTRVFCIWC